MEGLNVRSMKLHLAGLIGATLFLGECLICSCNGTHAPQQHPDEVDAVVRALMTNGYGTVNVAQDRTKGVMTLTGNVRSPDRKAYAEQIARVTASDYAIVNKIGVTTPPPTASQAIEDKYKAMLEARKDLDLHDIDYKAESGVLVLSGTVHSARDREEAVKLAKSVPNVERVVDEIKVRR